MASGKGRPDSKKTFLRDHGYGPARLAAVTARIDWSRPDAFGRAREALALYAATVAELVREAARGRRRQPGTFLNELVDNNDAAELPLLSLALRHTEQQDAKSWPGLTPAARARLEDAALASHWRLLRDGTLPAPRLPDIADVDSDTLIALYCRQACDVPGDPGMATTLRLLKFAGQLHEARHESRAVLQRHLRAIRKALDDAPVPLDHAAFRTLPAAVRRELLFTPGLVHAFLDAQAQAGARPPSPAFDALYLDRALDNLAAGTLDHVDVDTLFVGAAATPAFRAKIVAALANGSGSLECADAVRERLIAGADLPELCLVACAAGRTAGDFRRALSHLATLPEGRLLREALLRFALIAWQQAQPADIPAVFAGNPDFRARLTAGTPESPA